MKIYRIDGNRCYNEAAIGLSYHSTMELAEESLTKEGFYLEKRKWNYIGGHEPGSPDKFYYNKPLSEHGYPSDGTSYCYITEITVNTGDKNDVQPVPNTHRLYIDQ